MKVIMLNGSPHKNGCTNAALEIIADELKNQGVESEILWLGNGAVRSCIGCGGCKRRLPQKRQVQMCLRRRRRC